MMLSLAFTICQANYWLAFCDLSQYDYESKQYIQGRSKLLNKISYELHSLQECL